MKLLQTFGAKVRRARLLNDLTQEQLSEKTKLSVKHLSSIERGKRFVTCKTLIRLSHGLGVEAGDLFPVSRKAFELETNEMAAINESKRAFITYLMNSLCLASDVPCSRCGATERFMLDSTRKKRRS